jgi:outer membrane receptor protein involved in Fe transport
MTAAFSDALTFYAGYNEANRAPSPVELTCADEDDPCRLPNAFLADPPLEQVVAETFELGLRGRHGGGAWHAGLFRTTNNDDILFISAGALTNEGFFSNVGQTRRDGIELGIDGRAETLSWFANYTLLDATFRETLALPSPNNPTAGGGEVLVMPGDRLPLIPRHLFKAGLRIALGKFTLGGEILGGSDFHLRGDEGNDVARVGAYTVLNLRGDYRVTDSLRLFLNVDNVLGEEYETFGLFGEADEVLGDDFEDSRFLSPAMPRAAWIGAQLSF